MSRSRLLKLLEYLTAILLASLLAGGATAQQEDESTAETAETSASENASVDDAVADGADDADDADDVGEAAADAEDGVDTDLDEQTYEEDDDDFIPTEEIPADEPIPFPSNI